MTKLCSPVPRDSNQPVHLLIRTRILEVLRDGELATGDKLPAEPEWADQLGVSRMTLNKVLVSLVQDGWLERVKGKGTFVADRGAETKLKIGIVIAEDLQGAINNYYFGSLYFGLVDGAAEHGCQTDLIRLQNLVQDPSLADGFDGLVVINPPQPYVRALAELGASGHPMVLLGSTWPGTEFSCIDSDNVLAAAMAVRHLTELGHRRIDFIGACPNDANSIDRLRGYTAAMGICQGAETFVHPWSADATELSAEAKVSICARLSEKNPPTALVVGGPIIALQICHLAGSGGPSIPEGASLVTFDNPGFLAASPVALTTVVQPFTEMVKRAMDEITRLCENPLATPRAALCRPELIVRKSTAAPRPLSH